MAAATDECLGGGFAFVQQGLEMDSVSGECAVTVRAEEGGGCSAASWRRDVGRLRACVFLGCGRQFQGVRLPGG